MSTRFLAGGSIFSESPYHFSADELDGWDAPDDRIAEPEPRYWNMLAIGLVIGMITGTVLAWLAAGLIIWRLTHG